MVEADPRTIRVRAREVSAGDWLALFSAKSRRPKFVRIKRVTGSSERTFYLADGGRETFAPDAYIELQKP